MGYNVNDDIVSEQQLQSWILYVNKAEEAGIYNTNIQIMKDKINNYTYAKRG